MKSAGVLNRPLHYKKRGWKMAKKKKREKKDDVEPAEEEKKAILQYRNKMVHRSDMKVK